MTEPPITEIWAWVADMPGKGEHFASMPIGMGPNTVHWPLLGPDEERIRGATALALCFAHGTGSTLTLRRYVLAETVETHEAAPLEEAE